MGSASPFATGARVRRSIAAAGLLCAFAPGVVLPAQAPDTALKFTPGTIQYPQTMKPWSGKMALGASLITMPAAIAQEGATIRWPLFVYEYTLGLPAHFNLATSFSTEFVTNHIEAMPRWQFSLSDRLHGDIGYGVAYWFGQLQSFGFDNHIHGWMGYPYVGIGYDWGKVALTFQAKATHVLSLTSESGSLVASSSGNWYSGSSFRLILEQPLWTHTTLGFAVQENYIKFYYPQWPLFPTFDRYFWIPEVQLYFTL